MTQAERDRLVVLKKAKKKLITQKQAAEELGITERQVRRLLAALKRRGDKAVIHGLRGLPSNRKISADMEQEAVRILSLPDYRGVKPTMACECLAQKHDIEVSHETVRGWMIRAKLWRARRQPIEKIHEWRPRRSRFGELVQWDTSDHDWLEGRGEEMYLIAMVDDASSRGLALFVESDSTWANMAMLEMWLGKYGRMLACYTDKAGHFQTAVKTKRYEQRQGKDREGMPPTQIGRALKELNIAWIAAHSPQAKGRIERFFQTAQDRLVKGMRLAGVKTLDQANAYLDKEYLPWWNQHCTVVPASSDDAHRPLEKQQDLAAILSLVETRKVNNDYTIQYQGKVYAIERSDIVTGLRGAVVCLEQRRDGGVAIRFRDKYLRYRRCERPEPVLVPKPSPRSRKGPNSGGKSTWMKDFMKKPGPSLGRAIAITNATS